MTATVATRFLLPDPTSKLSPLKRTRLAIYLGTIATIIFRAELALFVGSVCLYLLVGTALQSGSLPVLIRTTIFPPVIAATVAGLALTVTIDTYFWRQSITPQNLLWPELSAFLSNIFPPPGSQGASEWGTSPFHWYFTSAIPRLLINPALIPLLTTIIMSPIALLRLTYNDQTFKSLLWPYLTYTFLYSFLPHKETRFIFPILPPLTTALAVSATYISNNRHRHTTYNLITLTLLISTLITALFSHAILLPLSSLTYPGAYALHSLHTLSTISPPQRTLHIHLSNLALQTGITRFQQHPTPTSPLVILPGSADGTRPFLKSGSTHWIYDKTSNDTGIYNDVSFWNRFDYAIVEWPADALPVRGWDVIDTIHGLGRPMVIPPDTGRGLLVMGNLRPAECVGQELERCVEGKGERRWPDGIMRVLEAMYGDGVVGRGVRWGYAVVHDVVREGWGLGGQSLTGGWWVHWSMERRSYVLKRGEGMSVRQT